MIDPTTAKLAKQLAELERRLRAVETGSRLEFSSVAVDEAGTAVDVRQTILDTNQGPARMAAALTAGLVAPADVVDEQLTVWFTDEQPAALEPGALWLQPLFGEPPILWRADGTGWARVDDPLGQLAAAVAAARDTLATGDGFILTFWSAIPPTLAAIGDLWFDTVHASTPYRWNGTGWESLVTNLAQSANYVGGEDGWIITPDGDAQLKDVAALGQVSGSSASFDTIELAGESIVDTLARSSIGKIISAQLPAQGADLGISTTVTKNFELNCGVVPGGRTYRAQVTLLCRNTSTYTTADRIQFGFRYTTDGSTPTTASPQMLGGFWDNSITPSTNWQSYTFHAEVDIATECQLRVAFTSDLVTGTGAYTIYASSSTPSRPVFALYDDGPLGARQDSALSLTGGGLAQFTKTFNASWVFGIDSSSLGYASNWFYIGDGEYGVGGMYGLVGFNSADIISKLSGSITPISLTLKWRPRTRNVSTGLDVRIVTHNYASEALAEADIQYPEGGWSDYPLTAVVNVSNTVPNTLVSTSLGTSVFSQFKAGTKKGVGMVTQIADTYAQTPSGSGTIYGDGSYEMQLVFVYNGTS